MLIGACNPPFRSFNKGDELTAKDIGDTDWWLGKDKEGKEGMVQRKDFLVIDDGS